MPSEDEKGQAEPGKLQMQMSGYGASLGVGETAATNSMGRI